MNVTEEISQLKRQIAERERRIAWLEASRQTLEALPAASFCGNRLDFDHLPHAEVVKVIRTIGRGAKWKKTPAGVDRIDYKTELEGIEICCYQGQPPPSCRIIEVEEYVPAVTLPATTRKVKKMICSPEMGAVMAHAAAKVEANNQPATPVS